MNSTTNANFQSNFPIFNQIIAMNASGQGGNNYDNDYNEETIVGDIGDEVEGSTEKCPPLSGSRFEYVKKKISGIKKDFYNKGSFWIRAANPIFISSCSAPSAYCNPDLFIWAPDYLPKVNIRCKYPECNGDCSRDGWSDNPIARRVVGFNTCYYLVTAKYVCKKCKKKMNSLHKRVFEVLPLHIQMQFPAIITHRSALDLGVLHQLRASMAESMGIWNFKNALVANHARRHMELEIIYLSKAQSTQNVFSQPTDFPEFFSETYGGFTPSEHYLSDVLIKFVFDREQSMAAQMVTPPAQVICMDQSFKVLLLVR